MKLKTVKTAKETGIPGAEFVIVDKNITEIIIGNVRIRKGESYTQSLVVLIETPFETAERFRVTAKLAGFPDAVSYHESEYDANTEASRLVAGAEITIAKVTVSLDDDGNVIDVSGEQEVTADWNATPF